MSRAIKSILLVSNIFPPDIGGPATFIPSLGSHLANLGYKVTVICTSDLKQYPEDSIYRFRLIRLQRNKNRLIQELQLRLRILWEISRSSIVFTNGLEHYVAWASDKAKRPFILKVVGDSVWETARNNGNTILDIDEYQPFSKKPDTLGLISQRRYKYIKGASCIITPSEYLRKMVIGWGVSPDKVIRVYNGVGEQEFTDSQAHRNHDDVLNIVFIGRLTNWKGVDALFLALKDLKGVCATIIGDGPQSPALMDLARRLKILDRVVFLGRLSKDKLAQEFKKIHVLVLPSLYEGLSHTLLEAGARAVPCIASNKGGNREVIEHGVNGFLVDPWDVEALKGYLRQFLDDEALRRKMGMAFQSSVKERFPFHQTVEKTIEAILSIQG